MDYIKIFGTPEYDREKAEQEYEKAKNEYLKTHAGDTTEKKKRVLVL